MNHAAGLWLDWMAAMSWQVLVFVIILAAAERLLADRLWPRLRHELWMLARARGFSRGVPRGSAA